MFDDYIVSIMKECGLELKTYNEGVALCHNNIPVPHTLNKSDEYLKGFILGYAQHINKTNGRRPYGRRP